MFVEKYS